MSQNLYNPFALPSPAFLDARLSNPVSNNFGTKQQQTSVPGLPTLRKPSFSPASDWQVANSAHGHAKRYPSYSNHQPRYPNHGNQFRGHSRHPFNSSPRTYSIQASPKKDFQNFPFSCRRCDRSFKTEEQYNEHVSEHVTCGIDGCTFVSHPKIVEKHIAMQHETGLALKIMSLNTPEDIAKWREERKKRFPTAAKVSEKIAAKKEQTNRGELLDDQPERFPIRTREKGRGRGRGRGRGARSGRGRNGNEFRENISHAISRSDMKRVPNTTIDKDLHLKLVEECPEIAPEDEKKGNLPVFRGTASHLGVAKKLPQSWKDATIEDYTSDEELTTEANIESTAQGNEESPNSQISDSKPGTSEALSAILGAYASDSEESLEEGELKEEADDKKSETVSQVAVNDDVSVPIAKRDKEVPPDADKVVSLNPNKRKRKRSKRGCLEETPNPPQAKPPNAPIRRKRLTLLQKLLQGEIRHERNVILQCVHYVVQNNFFGIGG